MEHCGVDAVVTVLFFSSCCRIFLVASLFACLMMAVNGTAPCPSYNDDGSCAVDGLDTISLSNIANQSSRMWANAIIAYAIFLFGIRELASVYEKVGRYISM